MAEPLELHCRRVARALRRGTVIPLLGAGANLCDRPPHTVWAPGSTALPSGWELSRHLASRFDYPLPDTADLVRVSQYVALEMGEGPLYASLREVFDVDFAPTSLHTLLAGVPGQIDENAPGDRHMLVLTTNYDDALETAFRTAGEPFDVVVYHAAGEHAGKFVHLPHDSEPRVIERATEYRDASPARTSVILKIHGAVDRGGPGNDSYVITEDDYIDYLTQMTMEALIPAPLLAKLQNSHFLFLGYSMRDWNLRVILRRIWREQPLRYRSWSIQLRPDLVDHTFWDRRNVEVRDIALSDYVAELGVQLTRATEEAA